MVGALNPAMCMHKTQFHTDGGWVLTLVSKFLQTSVIGTLVYIKQWLLPGDWDQKTTPQFAESGASWAVFFFQTILNTARL